MGLSIFTIGDEITSGEILNTNNQWMAERIVELGGEITHHLSVRDEMGDIQKALHYLTKNSKIILSTGGLGPTRDDITREAFALWAGRPLKPHE